MIGDGPGPGTQSYTAMWHRLGDGPASRRRDGLRRQECRNLWCAVPLERLCAMTLGNVVRQEQTLVPIPNVDSMRELPRPPRRWWRPDIGLVTADMPGVSQSPSPFLVLVHMQASYYESQSWHADVSHMSLQDCALRRKLSCITLTRRRRCGQRLPPS